jgi:uncharacterized membrane protein YfcA
MEAAELLAALALGLAAGFNSGLLGVGGGVLFVPALVIFLGLDLLQAEATSLLAVTLVAALGAWRQRRHGNVRLADGFAIGGLSVVGVVVGVGLANVAPERVLELAFAALQLYLAATLVHRLVRRGRLSAPQNGV